MSRKKKKYKSVFKRMRIYIFAIIIIVIILSFIKILSANTWDGKERLTLVLAGIQKSNSSFISSNIALISVDPKESSVVYILIPENALLDVPFGYDSYLASSVYGLGDLDKNRAGGNLLAKSIESTFGVMVNGSIIFRDDKAFPHKKEHLKSFFFSLITLLKRDIFFIGNQSKIESNLSFYDSILLWNHLRKFRNDQIKYVDLSDTEISNKITMPDNSQVLEIDKDLFDLLIEGYFQDSEIRKENIPIEIVNSTRYENLATEFGRILSHLGANVIKKSTSYDKKIEACVIHVVDIKMLKSNIVGKLIKNYKCETSDIKLDNSQSDITIILGENFTK